LFIFGLGLIGTSIFDCFSQSNYRSVYMPFSWSDNNIQSDQLVNISEIILKTNSISSIDIIWSAGKGGFSLNSSEYESELMSFEAVLRFSNMLSNKAKVSISFHLFSSAGGLFEGQRFVNNDSKPNPLRLYGLLKLKQEKSLLSYNTSFNTYIYRPSTVFGFIRNTRVGLISNLLTKSVNNDFVEIFASKSSLRDFIFVEDIANFVFKNIVFRDKPNQIYFLVSGKASSIDEIILIISNLLNRNVLCSYKANETNTLDNTFNSILIPQDLTLTTLSYGIYKTLNKILIN